MSQPRFIPKRTGRSLYVYDRLRACYPVTLDSGPVKQQFESELECAVECERLERVHA